MLQKPDTLDALQANENTLAPTGGERVIFMENAPTEGWRSSAEGERSAREAGGG